MLYLLSEERAPGTRYDRYFIEEYCKKFKETQQIEEVTSTLREYQGAEFVAELEKIIEQQQSKQDQQRMQLKKEEEAKK